MILSPVESMKSIIKELVWFQNLCWSPLCSQSLHHEFLLLFLYLHFSMSEATRRHLHTNSHIKHQAVKTRTWRCNYSELRLSFCLSLIVLLRRCVYQPVNVLFLSMNSEMWMNFFRRFLTCHLVCAHMQHIVCVCVCVCVCQQEVSKHSSNRLNKSLRVSSLLGIYRHSVMTDSCQTAVMSLRSGDWQRQTGSGPCGETETTCTIWGWKCRLKVFTLRNTGWIALFVSLRAD